MNFNYSLPINLNEFGFVQRESKNNKLVKNRCGRDFLYYVLNYYFADEFNPTTCGPKEIEERKIFGISLPDWLIWTTLSFYKMPIFLAKKGLVLRINQKTINSSLDFFKAMIFPRYLSADEALEMVEDCIKNGTTIGIDISIGLGGLIDHVLFVFGYDIENLYVFDTHNVEQIKYSKLTPDEDKRFIMKLPKEVVRNMWSRFGRVWVIEK